MPHQLEELSWMPHHPSRPHGSHISHKGHHGSCINLRGHFGPHVGITGCYDPHATIIKHLTFPIEN